MQTALSAPSMPASSAEPRHHTRGGRKHNRAKSNSSPEVPRRLGKAEYLKETYPVTPAIPGNQFAIQAFLSRLLHRPTQAEFTSANLKPGYRSSDRLIIKSPVDRSIVSHVQLESQEIRFGQTNLSAIRLRDMAILPEYRCDGFAERLLTAAEVEAKQRGAMLLLARGECYPLLCKQGWTSLGNDPVSVVSPQQILGRLPQPPIPESPFFRNQIPSRKVRIGRLTDLEQLQSLFERQAIGIYGAVNRTREQWAWLMSKQAHDRVYVFREDGQTMAYVVVRGASVVELVDTTDDHRGSSMLLKRVGADAIDQGRHTLRFYVSLTNPAHRWANEAGGQLFVPGVEESWMVRILSVRALLRRLACELYHRQAREFSELSLAIGDDEFLLRPGRRSLRVTRGRAARHRIVMTRDAMVQMLMGYRSVEELRDRRQLIASSKVALSIADQLFPTVLIWRTCWDDLPAIES